MRTKEKDIKSTIIEAGRDMSTIGQTIGSHIMDKAAGISPVKEKESHPIRNTLYGALALAGTVIGARRYAPNIIQRYMPNLAERIDFKKETAKVRDELMTPVDSSTTYPAGPTATAEQSFGHTSDTHDQTPDAGLIQGRTAGTPEITRPTL